MRPSRLGLAASVVYLVLGVVWVVGAHPPGSAPVEILWFAVVAAGGLFVPGLANHVSLARAYLAAPALAYAPEVSGLGFLAVTVALAGLTDLVDGTIARRMMGTSSFGGALDPVVDGVFLGSVAVGLSRGGTFPFWLVAVVIVRYLLPAVVGGALIVSHRPVELRHTLAGQVSTSLIIILLGGIALFRAFGQDTSNVVIAAEIVIPIATVSAFVHLGLTLRRPADNPDPRELNSAHLEPCRVHRASMFSGMGISAVGPPTPVPVPPPTDAPTELSSPDEDDNTNPAC